MKSLLWKGAAVMKFTYQVLSRRNAVILLVALFSLSVLLGLFITKIPSVLTSITESNSKRMPVCSTDRSDNVVCLTFDAAGSNQSVKELVRLLSRSGVKATFFVTGDFADRCLDSIELLYKNGHEIMNASDDSTAMISLKKEKSIKRINRCGDVIQAMTGKRPTLFRPPGGEYDASLLETVCELDMLPVKWDVDSYDSMGLDPEGIEKRVTSLAASGSILRFSIDGEHTLEALPTVIQKLKGKGYFFIPVSNMVYREDYVINHEGRQISMKD